MSLSHILLNDLYQLLSPLLNFFSKRSQGSAIERKQGVNDYLYMFYNSIYTM